MRYLALVCDYDGTIGTDGRVSNEAMAALERVRASGRKLILVTGRELQDLQAVLPQINLFELVVAENGALLYRPSTQEENPLAAPPAERFIKALIGRGVTPLSVGRAIVATWRPNETTVLEIIRDLGLELQVIFNKGAVMVLPASVNKATGLSAALSELKLSPHNAVGIGDAENDHAFLQLCECSAAVANALPKAAGPSPAESRARVRAVIEEQYTLSAAPTLLQAPGRNRPVHVRAANSSTGSARQEAARVFIDKWRSDTSIYLVHGACFYAALRLASQSLVTFRPISIS